MINIGPSSSFNAGMKPAKFKMAKMMKPRLGKISNRKIGKPKIKLPRMGNV